ncbi:SPOR domain-containing protein [Sagittula salina]|uniref:SPOR domain-containing protein n=1 Tax=Sagittula salina TaxID=2820268 RepID=UPI001FD74871|nr:SPOR domain-containing protein [Sagittula salina]
MADYTLGGHYAPESHRVGKPVSMVNLAGAAASLALIVGVGVWGYGVMARDVSGVPVVQAVAGPMRIAPADPGGTLADHQGLAVNTVAGTGLAEGPAQQLLLAPVPAGLAAEDVAPEAMVRVDVEAEAAAAAAAEERAKQHGLDLFPEEAEDPIQALAAQITAGTDPLTPLSDIEDVTSSGSDLDEDDFASAAPHVVHAGPGLARSLRPRIRPGGLQVASVGPVDAAVIAAAAETPTREINPDTLPAGTRLVQIGAFDSTETARSEWARLEGRFGEFLDGKGRVIQKAQSGGRTFYRLRAEGFTDLADARRFCAAFVAEKVDCIPVVSK